MKPDETSVIQLIQQYAGIALAVGVIAGTFLAGVFVSFRRTLKREVVEVKQQVATVKADLPAQVQTHIEKPIAGLQSQLDKSLADLAGTGSLFVQTMKDIMAGYQDQKVAYERLIALGEQRMQQVLVQNDSLSKQLFDLRLFVDDLQKGRAADYEKIRALELKQRQLEDIQQAQADGKRAQDSRIKELQAARDEAQREMVKVKAENADAVRQIALMRQQAEAYQAQIADLQTQLERLQGVEGQRAELRAKLAESERRITELEGEMIRLKIATQDNHPASTPQEAHEQRTD